MPTEPTEVTIKNWNPDAVQRRVEARLLKGMKVAVQFLVGEVRIVLNRSQPTAKAARGRKGLDPSKPGEPPKKVTAQLQQNVSGKVEHFPGMRIEGFIGANVNHARAQELGFVGEVRVRAHTRSIPAHKRRKPGRKNRTVTVKAHTKSIPTHTRRMQLAARPFLRPTVFGNRRRTREIIIRGR